MPIRILAEEPQIKDLMTINTLKIPKKVGSGFGHELFRQDNDDEEDLWREASLATPSSGGLSPNHPQQKK